MQNMQSKTRTLWGALSITLLALLISLFATGCSQGNVAASVNGENISEDEVIEQVASFREQNGLEDDQTWAHWLADNSKTAEEMRSDAIDRLVENKLIEQVAKEKGVTVSEADIDTECDADCETFGLSSRDELYETMQGYGFTKDTYRESVKLNLLEKKMVEQLKSDTQPSDEEIVSMANGYIDILDGARDISTIVVTDEATATDIKSKLDGGTDFYTLASENSTTDEYNGCSAFVGLDDKANEEVSKANKGDIIVSPTDNGLFFIIKVNDVYDVHDEGFTSIDQIPAQLKEFFVESLSDSASSMDFNTMIQSKKESSNIIINDMPKDLPYDVEIVEEEVAEENTLQPIIDKASETNTAQ